MLASPVLEAHPEVPAAQAVQEVHHRGLQEVHHQVLLLLILAVRSHEVPLAVHIRLLVHHHYRRLQAALPVHPVPRLR